MYYICFTCGEDEPVTVDESSLNNHRNHECAPSMEFAKCDVCGFFIMSKYANEPCSESGCSGTYRLMS